ncbi:unnamed protein product [Adineta ricciae]|uniref:Uncharacterized protein n=1 Tax=Adineta ricciae TaxID=249248 RepID=A0A814HYA6_ADIRI|nr:unnamed protein product [Adineta ricciae]CAF1017101.1 unnamed protein product [Adineta ricciae]
MTESYLTTDIIVIIVLVVVLILVGICAFFIHFYWTKIGVSEIWNTAKWSSMRSSIYQTVRRFSRASSGKYGSERPFSAASVYSEESDGSALPAPLRNKKSQAAPHSTIPIPPQQQQQQQQQQSSSLPPPPHSASSSSSNNAYSSTAPRNQSSDSNGRRNSRNQVQPVSTVSYNNSGRQNYGIKIGQAPQNTKIRNVHEYDERNPDGSVIIDVQRF